MKFTELLSQNKERITKMEVYITINGTLIDKVYAKKASAINRISYLRRTNRINTGLNYYYYEGHKIIDKKHAIC